MKLQPQFYACEKAVKGFLVFCDQEFECVHDVEVLISAAVPYEAGFLAGIEVSRLLTPYARIFRYPGSSIVGPSREQFNQALSSAEGLYNFVLSLLHKEVQPE